MAAEDKTHVLVLPYPAQGHLPPLLHLSKVLAANGIRVTIFNIESIHKQLLKSWDPSSAGKRIHFEALPFPVDIPFGYDASVQEKRVEFHQLLMSKLRDEFEALVPRLEPAPSCILADESLFWSKPIAKKFGLPSVSYFPGNAAWSSISHHLCLLASKGVFPLRDPECVIDYVPGLPPTKLEDFPEYLHDMEKETLEAWAKHPGKMKDATWVLVNSFYELEPHAFDVMKQTIGPRYVPIGPLFPLTSTGSGEIKTSLRHEEHGCLEWLQTQAAGSILYISFGSCSSLSEAQFEEFMEGLAASKQQFLWVLRPDTVLNGRCDLYQKCRELTKDQGCFVAWAPQLKVLAHPSIGGFLTHCGWNSTFESICNGVPMLGWPRHSDQSLNCKLMSEDWKIGMRLGAFNKFLKRAEIAEKLSDFMDKEKILEFRMNVKKLENAAREAAAPGGSSYVNLESFFREMRGAI
ncbi:hypothetical protein SELMODRAFT_448116 [Selaginella moellendorffii]|uniref:Glycosyltransferase n=1 Tax=Selaginella moellendorffii TaxID=88036 RepID=D8T4W7_SELML|nr:UDP-glycosyltransferase 85A3 [Selaginella moellendorffii]EFJ08249.1 hypothetical protein SELMODRAFT_448116 [Selaginella moellendorffii]|eukprot:XP_002990617.1 UDP-glycosyltransferase 85A3 [Selaginella moellendorffii]